MAFLWITLVTLFWTTLLGLAACIGLFAGALVGGVAVPMYILKWFVSETSVSVQPQKKDTV